MLHNRKHGIAGVSKGETRGSRCVQWMAALCGLLFQLLSPVESRAYSVLSHQAIIDAAWEDEIKPALLKRFPNATPDELSAAQAYAYGGAIIQDLGYYHTAATFSVT